MKRFSYQKQREILADCAARSKHLSDALGEMSRTYDSLVYADEATDGVIDSLPDFVPVDQCKPIADGASCVSFFSGAGGLDIGFESAGYETIADVEIVPMFCDTLRHNGHKVVIGPPFAKGDMSEPDEVIAQLEKIGISKNFPGGFHGGPPCQSFSIAANQRFNKNGEKFKRTGFNHAKLGNLLFCYYEIACAIYQFMQNEKCAHGESLWCCIVTNRSAPPQMRLDVEREKAKPTADKKNRRR